MTAMLQAPAGQYFGLSAGFGMKPVQYRKDDGVFKVEGAAVFRSGTFRDMYGDQTTWESMHITQMVANFNMLRNGNVFPDVPVRDGHQGMFLGGLPGNGKLVGYHTQLTSAKLKGPHDGEEYDYLLADYEILDPQAAYNVESGLWRNKSAEIIRYRSNNEAEYWPVYGGVAFVDIPAVEGLKFSSNNGSAGTARTQFFVYMDKELSVSQPTQTSGGNGTGLPFQVGLPTQHVFSVNGAQVQDYAAVQNHINVLEQFRTEVTDNNRASFVNSLAVANRIPVTEVDKTLAFARTLTTEQFSAWQETYSVGQQGAPTVTPALGPIANGVTGTPTAATGQVDSKFSTALGVVAGMKSAGIPKAQIEAGQSYKLLLAANMAPAL